jgi:gamma-glutamylaminecyclotransferase
MKANSSAPVSPAPAAPALIFVYGTLKRGGSNHAQLAGQTYLGPARTQPGFTLYSLGEYPGLVATPATAPADCEGVSGELWSVDAAALARLDAFEGIHEGLYARVPARLAAFPATVPADDAARAELYLYLGEIAGRPLLGSFWPV